MVETMKSPRAFALFAILAVGACVVHAETPPWWNNGQNTESPNEPAQVHAPQTSAPVLEEYTISRKPVETVDDRARQRTPMPSPVPAPSDGDDASRYAVQPGDLLLV